MQIEIEPGKYVVAVSGGVDSMVLLDLLRAQPGVELVVAHYDHGIRADSAEDRRLVERVASSAGLEFVSAEGNLGKVSEAAAREARYAFLRQVKDKTAARAIITAHHQDDVLETVIINLLRGTNRKGLSSLRSGGDLLRPLLGITKNQLRDYASAHEILWREDSTNTDEAYLRNYVRHNITPKLSVESRGKLLDIIHQSSELNSEMDEIVAQFLPGPRESDAIKRAEFIRLPHAVSREVIAGWLRQSGIRDFDSPTLERLVVAAKTAQPGTRYNVQSGWWIYISKHNLALTHAER